MEPGDAMTDDDLYRGRCGRAGRHRAPKPAAAATTGAGGFCCRFLADAARCSDRQQSVQTGLRALGMSVRPDDHRPYSAASTPRGEANSGTLPSTMCADMLGSRIFRIEALLYEVYRF
jgi:hypothetical protein